MHRVEVNPEICGGKPVIAGTRIMLSNIFGMIAGGYSVKQVVEAYPDLTADDVNAALEYAARVIDDEQVILR